METVQQAATKLAWILNQAKVEIREKDIEDDEVWITTADGAVIFIAMGEREIISIVERKTIPCPVFRLGYMKWYSGGHWEPDDVDFYEEDDTPSAYRAAEYAMLYPEQCRVNAALEAICANEPIMEEM